MNENEADPLRDQCGAQKRQGEGLCALPAGWGTDHVGAGRCRRHAGNSPSGKAAGQKALQARILNEAMVTFGLPVDIAPGEALLQEVRRTAGHVQWLGARIAEMKPDELVWGAKTETEQTGRTAEGPIDTRTTVAGASINTWLDLYQRERQHLVNVCKVAAAAGIAERQVQLAEQFGERMGQFLVRSHADAGIELDDAGIRRLLQASAANIGMLEVVR